MMASVIAKPEQESEASWRREERPFLLEIKNFNVLEHTCALCICTMNDS